MGDRDDTYRNKRYISVASLPVVKAAGPDRIDGLVTYGMRSEVLGKFRAPPNWRPYAVARAAHPSALA